MDVRDKLRSQLFETLIPTPADTWPDDGADLFEFGLDSLRVMRLLVFIEDELGVSLPDHEVTTERLRSVESLVDWVGQHQ